MSAFDRQFVDGIVIDLIHLVVTASHHYTSRFDLVRAHAQDWNLPGQKSSRGNFLRRQRSAAL